MTAETLKSSSALNLNVQLRQGALFLEIWNWLISEKNLCQVRGLVLNLKFSAIYGIIAILPKQSLVYNCRAMLLYKPEYINYIDRVDPSSEGALKLLHFQAGILVQQWLSAWCSGNCNANQL